MKYSNRLATFQRSTSKNNYFNLHFLINQPYIFLNA
jgi:hypothetical protein